jgi:hypothetical protein
MINETEAPVWINDISGTVRADQEISRRIGTRDVHSIVVREGEAHDVRTRYLIFIQIYKSYQGKIRRKRTGNVGWRADTWEEVTAERIDEVGRANQRIRFILGNGR